MPSMCRGRCGRGRGMQASEPGQGLPTIPRHCKTRAHGGNWPLAVQRRAVARVRIQGAQSIAVRGHAQHSVQRANRSRSTTPTQSPLLRLLRLSNPLRSRQPLQHRAQNALGVRESNKVRVHRAIAAVNVLVALPATPRAQFVRWLHAGASVGKQAVVGKDYGSVRISTARAARESDHAGLAARLLAEIGHGL